MADAPTPTPAPTPAPTPVPAPTPAPTAWYDGKADAETVGYWQNKGWKHDDPATVALEATKAAREAQKFVGVPADQIIRLPKDAKDEAGWNAVYSRLGKPAAAKDYDFTSVKSADGTAIEPAFADTIREAAFSNHLTKDAATAFAQSVVKHLDSQKASQSDERTAKLATEKAELAKSWGPNADINKLTAAQGAKRLGVDPETVALLESQIGYSKVMEMFRKIGAGTSEDTFVDAGKGGSPKTMESAAARLAELQTDPAWAKRLLGGDAAARREFQALTEQVAGVSAAAA